MPVSISSSMRRTPSRSADSVDEIIDYNYESGTTAAASTASRRRCWSPTPQRLLALGVFLFGAYINSVAQAFLQREQNPITQTLPDLGFDTLRYMPEDALYADLALYLIDGIAFLRFVLDSRLRFLFLRRRLLIQGVIFLLRAVSISVTHLPNPYPHCKAPATDQPPCVTAFMIMLGLVKTCNDVMFSGHAVSMTLSFLFLYWHCDLKHLKRTLNETLFQLTITLTKMLFIVGWIMGLLTVIATKFHYTLDVFIGVIIAALFFLLFYTLVSISRLVDDDFEEYPYDVSIKINTFISWFERDSKPADPVGHDL